MRKISTGLLVLAGVLLGVIPAIHADSLQLKNGNSVQGKYLGGTERAVQFEADGKVQIYYVNQILSINFGTVSPDGGVPSNAPAVKPKSGTALRPAVKNGAQPASATRPLRKANMHSEQVEAKTARASRTVKVLPD
jgi:hypothetical protein